MSAAVFIAFYLGSNLLLAGALRRAPSLPRIEWLVVILDVAAVTLALYLAEDGGDLFVLYFVVLFLSALADGVALAAGAALVIGIAHLFTATSFVDMGELIQRGYIVRLPFLFAVAIFFGNLVQGARLRQRESRESFLRRHRMEFLSSMSHDLRNPLGVVESLATLLLEGDAGRLSSDQDNLVQRIHVSIRQALNLSNNLIDAERIELDNFPLRRRPMELRAVVEESLVLARTAADLKGVALVADLVESGSIAEIDAVQVERALSNLLSNAIKFTPGGGRVRLALELDEESLRVKISDSGPGMAEDLLQAVGTKHLQGADAKGSGLGLYIASAIATAHGGRLWAESAANVGTTVTMELPRRSDLAPVDPIASPEPVPYLAEAG